MNIEYKFDDLDDFYREALNVEPEGNQWHFDEIKNEECTGFRGLSRENIHKYKYGYTPGVDMLGDIQANFPGFGASKFTTKWSDTDGEEMSMERAYDSVPFLKQRRRTVGNNSGKFVTLHINVAEVAGVTQQKLLNKALTAVAIANRLESLGYRVRVNAVYNIWGPGRHKNQYVDNMFISVPLKKFENPLNLALLINGLSPWFFRYWIFLFMCAKIDTNTGLGTSGEMGKKDTREDIYIDNGECLDPESSKIKIEAVTKLFEPKK